MQENFIEGISIFSLKHIRVEVNGGRISSVTEGKAEADGTPFLAPGFLDIQVNGYRSKDYSADLNTSQIETLIRELASSGTTKHFPTIITNGEDRIIKSIRQIVTAKKESTLAGRAIPGIHIEGPFISPSEGARGAHDPQYIRPADFKEFLRWQEAAEGAIRIVTVSPENEETLEFIHNVALTGVIVGIGHTDASPEMIEKAVDAGARLSTHLGNGSPSLIPRLKNFIWKQLAEDRLSADFIADGFHLPPYTLKTFVRCKGPQKSILVSDVTALGGNPPGLYRWGAMTIQVFPDGHLGLRGTENLAGASHLLDRGVAFLASHSDLSLPDAVRCVTINPSTLVGLPCWDTDPPVGENTDLVSFTLTGDGIRVNRVIFYDTILYESMEG